MEAKHRTLKTLEIILGVAKFYKEHNIITQRQKIIIDFNVCGGLPNFKNMVKCCDLIEEIEEFLRLYANGKSV